jgi:hypothetical protein
MSVTASRNSIRGDESINGIAEMDDEPHSMHTKRAISTCGELEHASVDF